MPNPKSTAQIAGHPIHPMLIPFPIVFFVSTFVADLIYWQSSSAAWATATLWLLGAGLIMAALAAVVGLTDVLGDIQIRNLSDAWLHAGGNVVVVLIELYNWYSRYDHGAAAILPTGLILSLIVVLILLFTGWKGWEMVYRHRVGVADLLVGARAGNRLDATHTDALVSQLETGKINCVRLSPLRPVSTRHVRLHNFNIHKKVSVSYEPCQRQSRAAKLCAVKRAARPAAKPKTRSEL